MLPINIEKSYLLYITLNYNKWLLEIFLNKSKMENQVRI
jgi:hypothetical protein